MAISSRYRTAFDRAQANAAGPSLPEVSGFTPGSVTTPAAILKGVSMYAKARRDDANAKAANASAAAAQASLQQSQNVADDYTRAQTEKLRAPVAPAEPKPVATPARITLTKAHQQLLGMQPSADDTYSKDDVATALGIYRSRTRPTGGGSGRAPSAAAVKQSATARAQNDFMRIDAPLVGRHTAFLLNEPYKDAAGSYSPGAGGYDPEGQAVAAQHLGIDFDAWKAHDPENFPDGVSTSTSDRGKTTKTIDNSKQRAAALAWQHSTIQNALNTFRTQRIAQYASQYISPTDDAAPSPDATQSADPYSDFEQQFLQGLQGAAQ